MINRIFSIILIVAMLPMSMSDDNNKYDDIFSDEEIGTYEESIPKQAAIGTKQKYTSDYTLLFSEADFASEIIGALWQNSVVTIKDTSDGWAHISYDTRNMDTVEGYVRTDALSDSFTKFPATDGDGRLVTYEYMEDLKYLFPAGRISEGIGDAENRELEMMLHDPRPEEWYVVVTETDDIKIDGRILEGLNNGCITIYNRPEGTSTLTALRIVPGEAADEDAVYDLSYSLNNGKISFNDNKETPFSLEVGFHLDSGTEARIRADGKTDVFAADDEGIAWIPIEKKTAVKMMNFTAENNTGISVADYEVAEKIDKRLTVTLIILTIIDGILLGVLIVVKKDRLELLAEDIIARRPRIRR